MPASVIQQYPQLAQDPQFMALYQQLMDPAFQQGTNGRGYGGANSPQGKAITDALTARARALGMPADREISPLGNDISIHAQRTAAIKSAAFAGGAIVGAPLLNAALSGGGGVAAAVPSSFASYAAPAGSSVATGIPSIAMSAAPGLAAGGGAVASGVAPAAVSAGSRAAGTVAGTTAATGTGFSWRNFLAQAIPVAGSLIGAKMAAGQQDKASAAEQQAADRALELQRQQFEYAKQQDAIEQARLREETIYSRERADQIQAQQQGIYAPYLGLGAAASGSLAFRMGLNPSQSALPAGATGSKLPTSPNPAAIPPYNPNQLTTIRPGNAQGIVQNPSGPPLSNPGTVPRGTLASFAQSGPQNAVRRAQAAPAAAQAPAAPGVPGQTITMRSPDGEEAQVPAELVAHFQQLGGQVVQGAA